MAEVKKEKVKKANKAKTTKSINKIKPKVTKKKMVNNSTVKKAKNIKEKEIKEVIVPTPNRIVKKEKGIIAFVIFCLLILFISMIIVDYSTSALKSKKPIFVITKEDKLNQMSVYYGLFYKAWKCDGDNEVKFLTYDVSVPTCALIITYQDGVYTNPYGIKMTKQQVNTIYRYYSNEINRWKNVEDFERAYKLANEFNSKWWVTKNVDIYTKRGIAHVAVFEKQIYENGEYSWVSQYEDENYQKCVIENENGKYEFADYRNGYCSSNWKEIEFSQEFCSLVKEDNSLINSAVSLNKFCD